MSGDRLRVTAVAEQLPKLVAALRVFAIMCREVEGAEKLLGRGDALYQSATGTIRIHGAFIDDDEIHSLVKAIKA